MEDLREPDLRGPVRGIPKILCNFFRVFDGPLDGVDGREVFSLLCGGTSGYGAGVRRGLGVGGMMVVLVAVVVVDKGRYVLGLLLLSSRTDPLDWREWVVLWG